jgi:hypothetical protein
MEQKVHLSANSPVCVIFWIKNDTKVYPSPDMMGKLFALEAMPLNIDRIRPGS